MSSTADAGYYADQRVKLEKTKCPKSKDQKHEFKSHGGWPSVWRECKHCGLTTYSK